ncbi:hypothetical protein EB796_009971 [Bugula neritina]|uniref:Uncharacterized protein n=1 Tax=Bugula neritina TaxID=10212 RepID=A0A7J7K180_BUGNE|nr:hypothetical protein EB796_009971 [Bugula neritina]
MDCISLQNRRNSVTEGRISLEMELLELRRRNARMSLMLKGSGSSHTPLIDSFIQIQNNIYSDYRKIQVFFTIC